MQQMHKCEHGNRLKTESVALAVVPKYVGEMTSSSSMRVKTIVKTVTTGAKATRKQRRIAWCARLSQPNHGSALTVRRLYASDVLMCAKINAPNVSKRVHSSGRVRKCQNLKT